MRKVNKPRCYKKFHDDRTCDVCHISKECYDQKQISREIERLVYRCNFRIVNTPYDGGGYWYECKNKEKKDKYGEPIFTCKPDIFCFPDNFGQQIRKEKLEKLEKTNDNEMSKKP